MPDYSYILFHKTPLQLRSQGARGGKTFGRNQRARRALMPLPPAAVPLRAAPRQTTAEAIALLDAQFTPEGRKRLAEAMKRRWAVKRAASAVKKTARKKRAAKKAA
jgi:hypothetical protein